MERKVKIGRGFYISQALSEKRNKLLQDLPEELEELSRRFEDSIPIFPIILDPIKFKKCFGRELEDDFLYVDLFIPTSGGCCIYFDSNPQEHRKRIAAQKYLWDSYEISSVIYNMTNLRTVVSSVFESRGLEVNKELRKLYRGFLECDEI